MSKFFSLSPLICRTFTRTGRRRVASRIEKHHRARFVSLVSREEIAWIFYFNDLVLDGEIHFSFLSLSLSQSLADF